MTATTLSTAQELEALQFRQFAVMHHVYLECSAAMREVVDEMVAVVAAPDATEAERRAAVATLREALIPAGTRGRLGVDLEASEAVDETDDGREVLRVMDLEEATFADRLRAAMAERGLTQQQLAERMGVGQPAVSMLLNRLGRPQRRTVRKAAEALDVTPADLWPGMAEA